MSRNVLTPQQLAALNLVVEYHLKDGFADVSGLLLRQTIAGSDRDAKAQLLNGLVPDLLRESGRYPDNFYSATPLGALECVEGPQIRVVATHLRDFVRQKYRSDPHFRKITWGEIVTFVQGRQAMLTDSDFNLVCLSFHCLGCWGGSGVRSPSGWTWERPLAAQLEDVLEIDDIDALFLRVQRELLRQQGVARLMDNLRLDDKPEGREEDAGELIGNATTQPTDLPGSPFVVGVGATIANEYTIERVIGSGGQASVYLARSRNGQAVALRIPLAKLKPDLQLRWNREAEVARRVASVNVAKVFSAGVDRGIPWAAWEYLDGRNMEEEITVASAQDLQWAKAVLQQISVGLSDMHGQDVVHCDLSPRNIFLVRSTARIPVVKLLDFGLAKILSESFTGSTNFVAGSPLWMSPEQMQGRRDVAEESDVWTFGLLAFYMLTGQTYWRSIVTPFEYVVQVFNAPRIKASERAAEIDPKKVLPTGFDDWFGRCTNNDPKARFSSIGDAWVAFEAICSVTGSKALDDTPATWVVSAAEPVKEGAVPPPILVSPPVSNAARPAVLVLPAARFESASAPEPPPQLFSNTGPPREPAAAALANTRITKRIGAVAAAILAGVLFVLTFTQARMQQNAKLGDLQRPTMPALPSTSAVVGARDKAAQVPIPTPVSSPSRSMEAWSADLPPDAVLRARRWFASGIGTHVTGGTVRPLHERKLGLGDSEMQIGSFRCRMDFDETGDPKRAYKCAARATARTTTPLDLGISCAETDDRTLVNCWSSEFSYSTGDKLKVGRFSLTVHLR